MKEETTLYITATPIGNLEDMTLRSIRILKDEVNSIFCEDTRQTGKLLKHFGIEAKLYSFHSHSSDKIIEKALHLLENGESIAYLSDCGTPGVSDPGSKLADAAFKNNLRVSPLPGASALTALASICGFPGKNISFGAFLSKKPGKRVNELKKLSENKSTIIIYESPHRIYKTLTAVKEIFPEKNIIIARELTKMYEEIIRINTSEIENFEKIIKDKGEFCIAIDNN